MQRSVKLSEPQIWLVEWLREKELDPRVEYRFCPPRLWRFDVAVPALKIAFEVEGGVWKQGRHTRGKGFIDDCEKYNTAAGLGWRVYRFTPQQVLNGSAALWIEDNEFLQAGEVPQGVATRQAQPSPYNDTPRYRPTR